MNKINCSAQLQTGAGGAEMEFGSELVVVQHQYLYYIEQESIQQSHSKEIPSVTISSQY